jgi:hypothetical protein
MLLSASEVMDEQHEIGPGVGLDRVRDVGREDDRVRRVEAQPLAPTPRCRSRGGP